MRNIRNNPHATSSAPLLSGSLYNSWPFCLQCLELVRQQIDDKILEAREIGNVGAVHLASGDFDRAVECHLEHLQIAVNAGNKVCPSLLFVYLSFVYCLLLLILG